MKFVASLLAATAIVSSTAPMAHAADDAAKIQQRVVHATGVLHRLNNISDKDIPNSIAHKARCVIVIPSFKKGAFLVGAEYGQGLASCYVDSKGWSAPVFVRATGASFGLQAGAQSTELVLVGVTKDSGQNLLKEKVKLGGDIAVAAGPVGRDSKAEAGILANAGLLTYSRNKGLFAGVDLNGDEIQQNGGDTKTFYGKDISYETILNGGVPTPAKAKGFTRELTRVFGGPKNRG